MSEVLAGAYNRLSRVYSPSWRNIPSTNSQEWIKEFERKVENYEPWPSEDIQTQNFFDESPRSGKVATDDDVATAAENMQKDMDNRNTGHVFFALSAILNRMDVPLAVAARRLRAVQECEETEPLTADEVLNYSKNLAGFVSAPPETSNLSDPSLHQLMYPSYHFLPFPSIEEIQNSQLAFCASKAYGDICFPPVVDAKLLSLGLEDKEIYDTSLIEKLRGSLWSQKSAREYFYRITCTSATPNCQFLYSVGEGQLRSTEPLNTFQSVLDNRKPLLIPGPFPRTFRVQAHKEQKRPSRPVQLCLKLKGKAAAAAASQNYSLQNRDDGFLEQQFPTDGSLHAEFDRSNDTGGKRVSDFEQHSSHLLSGGEGLTGHERQKTESNANVTRGPTGLMLGAARRIHSSVSSSESSSGSSDDDTGDVETQ